MARFTLVNGDDWHGLYVDDKLVLEGHSLPLLEVLGIALDHGPVTEVVSIDANYRWLEELGYLPPALIDVKVAGW